MTESRHTKEDVLLPKEINAALGLYEQKVMAALGGRGISFIAALTLMAFARKRNVVEDKYKKTLTIANISERSNRTQFPVLVSEIESFLVHLRFILDYPFDVIGSNEVYDELIVGQFTHAEFVSFCIYLDGLKKDAGFELYTGPTQERE